LGSIRVNNVVKKAILNFEFFDFTGNRFTFFVLKARQPEFKTQFSHFGFLGTHCKAPNSMMAWLNSAGLVSFVVVLGINSYAKPANSFLMKQLQCQCQY